ncbi:MAG: glycosyltransferase family 4 protein [Verrucomicrobiota bacterium]|nr:glycosyltransferase family 4 protein [Verrucomicrobiota bacterium]
MSASEPRILFLHHTALIGGAERHLLSVARHFRETSEVILFGDGPLRAVLEKAGVRVRVFQSAWAAHGERRGAPSFSSRNIADVLRLAWRISRAASSADLLVANSPKALLASSLARLVRQKPLLWMLHDLLNGKHFHPRGIRLLVRTANRSAARILADSQADADAYISAGGRADLVRVIHCGVAPFPLIERKANDTFTLGVFGRITSWKGHDVVLRALAHVPEVNAIFVGAEEDAAYARSLRDLSIDLGLTSRVRFLGFREDVAQLMQQVDCIVHASTEPEPFGLVIVEGMLAQMPVIATRAGGATEIIEEGESGLLVRPGDASEMAAAIKRILSAPEEAARMAMKGYERARAHFSEDRMLREAEKHFHEIAHT